MGEGSGGGRSERSERSARRAQSARRARCARTIAATDFHVVMKHKKHTNVDSDLSKYFPLNFEKKYMLGLTRFFSIYPVLNKRNFYKRKHS